MMSRKFCGVRSDENWRSEQRSFQDIVSAARHQAAADECEIGKLVQAGQLTDAVEQEYPSREWAQPVPLRASLISKHSMIRAVTATGSKRSG